MNRKFFSIAPVILSIGCATPFQKAILTGNNAKLRGMIEAGYDVNRIGTGTDFGERPLFTAASVGNLSAARLLLDSGADVNGTQGPRNWVGWTPLASAAWWGHADMADLLLKAGANPDPGGDNAPLLAAVCMPSNNWDNPPHKDVVRVLLRAGASPDISRWSDYWKTNATPLSCAVRKGDAEVVRLLLEHGADVDQQALNEAEAPGRSLMKRLLTPSPAEQASAHAAPLPSETLPRSPQTPAAARPERTAPDGIDHPAYRLASRPQDLALIIGVEEYLKLPRAEFAANDASAMRKHLEALGLPPRNIIYLSGQEATRSTLQGYLEEWLPKNAKPESTVFFFYSGHGAPDPKTGEAYLVPWDGNPSFLQSTAYPLKRLYGALGELNVRGVVVALDSCFSGAGGRSVLAAGARPLVMKLEETAPLREGMTLFAAASGDEITATVPEYRHGLFTYFFLKGLSGGAKDPAGKITAKSLYDYLLPQVQDEARRQNREQTPALQGQADRELVRF